MNIPDKWVSPILSFLVVTCGGLVTWGVFAAQLSSAQVQATTNARDIADMKSYREEHVVKKDEIDDLKDEIERVNDKLDKMTELIISMMKKNGTFK